MTFLPWLNDFGHVGL